MRVGLLGGDYHIAGNILWKKCFMILLEIEDFAVCVILFKISVVLFRGDHL